jgi:hypothetical protein
MQSALMGIRIDNTGAGMGGQQKFNDDFSGFQDLGRPGKDDHSHGNRRMAGGHQGSRPLHLYQADPAYTAWFQVRGMAQSGNPDAVFFSSLEDGHPLRDFDLITVDRAGQRSHTSLIIGKTEFLQLSIGLSNLFVCSSRKKNSGLSPGIFSFQSGSFFSRNDSRNYNPQGCQENQKAGLAQFQQIKVILPRGLLAVIMIWVVNCFFRRDQFFLLWSIYLDILYPLLNCFTIE